MSKKRKNKKDILKNTLLITLSFILSIVLVFQIKESIGSIVNKLSVDQTIDNVVAQAFSTNYPPRHSSSTTSPNCSMWRSSL